MLKVVQIGLGPLGKQIARYISEKEQVSTMRSKRVESYSWFAYHDDGASSSIYQLAILDF